MPVLSTAKRLSILKNGIASSRLVGETATRETHTKSILTLFSHFNLFTWFNEFCNIEITLEEFAPAKKEKGYRVPVGPLSSP